MGGNKKLKLLYIMELLLKRTDENNGVTIGQITEYLMAHGISAERKSIYDDIETLKLFGMDIESRRSKTFEYYLASREFQLAELKLLVDAVQSSKFITAKKSRELIRKIETLCSEHQGVELQREVAITGRVKTLNESIYYNTDLIHTAIVQNRMIEFNYFEWAFSEKGKVQKAYRKDGSRYSASPYCLTWDDENYYLIAYDSKADKIKHFRVDKITGLEVVSRPREGSKIMEGFNSAEYSVKTFSMYGGQEEVIRLEMDNKLLGVAIDRFGPDVNPKLVSGGKFRVNVKVAVSPTFFSWLFNFGTDIKIISPKSVAEQYREKAKAIAKAYKK